MNDDLIRIEDILRPEDVWEGPRHEVTRHQFKIIVENEVFLMLPFGASSYASPTSDGLSYFEHYAVTLRGMDNLLCPYIFHYSSFVTWSWEEQDISYIMFEIDGIGHYPVVFTDRAIREYVASRVMHEVYNLIKMYNPDYNKTAVIDHPNDVKTAITSVIRDLETHWTEQLIEENTALRTRVHNMYSRLVQDIEPERTSQLLIEVLQWVRDVLIHMRSAPVVPSLCYIL